ncbi:hypothetical protein BC941DRAFT_417573 [Chlamydoabsidia padenii]|nr:hypothetical protein BC941DRAFT_417573 [Chlamydoabsidia padenii]
MSDFSVNSVFRLHKFPLPSHPTLENKKDGYFYPLPSSSFSSPRLTLIMKFTAITTLFALAVSTVFAQNVTDTGVAINIPARGDVWNAGTTQTIKFTMTDPSITTIDGIVLMGGDQSNLQAYLLVASNVPVNGGQYAWSIPKNVPTMPSFALVFKTSKGLSYSPYFTIIGAAPGQNALNATSIDFNHLPTATSTGAASSGASSGASSTASGSAGAKPSNAGENLKAGVFGMVSAAAAVAVLAL